MSGKKAAKIARQRQDLRDEMRLLRHPPGSVLRDLEVELIADRKRDESAKRAKKLNLKPPLSKEEAEAQATHMARTAHGLVTGLNDLFLEHVVDGQPSQPATPAKVQVKSGLPPTPVTDAIHAGRHGVPDWQLRGHSLDEVRRVRGSRTGAREHGTDR